MQNPQKAGDCFVATETGVYRGTTGGSWGLVEGLPAHRTETLFWHDGLLYVGTYGAGLYGVDFR